MNPLTARGRRGLRPRLTRAVAVLGAGALALGTATGAAAAPDNTQHGRQFGGVPVTGHLSKADARRLATSTLKKPTSLNTGSVTAKAGPVDPIDLRVLVVATTGDPNPDGLHTVPPGSWDWNLSTLTNALDYAGTPYDTYKSSTKQLCVNGSWKINYAVDAAASACTSGNVVTWGSVTADRLWDGGVHAYYQGVMLSDGALLYSTDGATYQYGMTSAEWSVLWTFEAQFGTRMVSAYTYPTADYGFTGLVSADGNATTASYTSVGAAALGYVKTSSTLPIRGAWIYRGTVSPTDTTTQPIIKDAAGNTLGVIKTYPAQGNRQTLALTFNSARYLPHGALLGYGLVSWVTGGKFLGFQKALLDPQPDDVFIEDDLWRVAATGANPVCGTNVEDPSLATYRITGSDLNAVIRWQSAKQQQPTSAALKLELPFVGEGSVAGYWPNDTLTATARTNQARFKWINHTYTHANLDAISYADAVTEITRNNQVATTLGLGTYNTKNFIQPDISGLTNPNFLKAAYDSGIRYLISDTSRTGNPGLNGPNEGTLNTLGQPGLLEVARYPVNLYYNVSTPAQWLAEDNCLYPAGAYGNVSSYTALLDRESDNLLRYLLEGDNRPLMFHQPNLRAYDGVHSLLGDLVDATLTKYNRMTTVPITSPTQDGIAALQSARMAYNDAWKNGNLSASVVPNTSITLHSDKAVVVPLTGFKVAAGTPGVTSETYAGRTITYVGLSAGQTLTLPTVP